MDGVLFHRFRYFPPAGERLAYNAGIIQNLKKNRLKLLVPFFLIREGSGLAAAEAIACGLPVVATD